MRENEFLDREELIEDSLEGYEEELREQEWKAVDEAFDQMTARVPMR